MSDIGNPFAITRIDGRSNAEVLIDTVKDAEPGRVFTFAELADALQTGTMTKYAPETVTQTVAAATERLLKEHHRTLYNVRGVGYRVAHAREHTHLAMVRKRRADFQLKRGLQTLQNVRLDEMTENERNAHLGTLMIVGALYQNQVAYERRQKRTEDAIEQLRVRVDAVAPVAA